MSDDKTIIRTPHSSERPYFVMSRETAQDRNLTFEARGMLAYLLSKPDDWQVQIKDLQQHIGRDKVKAILKELEAAGYLTVERDRHNERGRFARNIYRVHETPFTENPSTVNPSTVEPLTEKPSLTYKREHKVQKGQSTESIAPGGATREKATVPASQMNPMKDAIAAAFGWDWKYITRANAGMIQRVAKDLCDAGVEPNEVQAIYNWCKAQGWPGTFTPMALSKHLASWRAQSRPKPNQTVGMAGVVQWVTADDPAPWEVAR